MQWGYGPRFYQLNCPSVDDPMVWSPRVSPTISVPFWLGPLAPDIHEAFKGTQEIWPNVIPRFLRLKRLMGCEAGYFLENTSPFSGRTKTKSQRKDCQDHQDQDMHTSHIWHIVSYSLEKSNSTRCIITIGYSFIDYQSTSRFRRRLA